MKAALLSIALILLCGLKAFPQTSTPAAASAVKVGKAAAASLPPEKSAPVKPALFARPPTIDGKLDDEVWKTAAVLKDFYQVQPGDNIVPENRTEVRLGYDPRFLYVAFHCFDDPAKVRANIAKRDNIFNDDY
ncbi:MAG TPA: hypothetical protein VKA97_07445, partial [Pyrinomonadaceae bacterium]|nr:hypothetical protein [Pyrinomonadaceae bacterium]